MDIFNFFKKEKPIFTGYRFGFGSGAGGEGETIVESTGGTIVEDGSTKYHVFLNDDVFTCADGPHSCTVLAIGGGGGSGDSRVGAGAGGGGGAGGYVNAPFTITNGTYPVTVGAGGPGRPTPSNNIAPYPDSQFAGTSSVVNTIVTAYGGGQGGGHGSKAGRPGASAGGGQDGQGPGTANRQQGTTNPITPTPQGNAGGSTSSGSGGRGGGGGGGASGTGNSGNDTRGGSGGDGVTAAPSFPVPLISPVVPGYTGLVCGGGHGGGGPTSEHTAQNAWGGGGRSNPTTPQVNTGRDYSGGGGGANPIDMPEPNQVGHAGGKGLVIIKYTI